MLAAFGGTLALRQRGERYVSTGLLLIGVAAFIGALRFGINPGLADLHKFVSSLATCTGLPLIAIQFAASGMGWPGRDGRMNTMGASVVGFAMFGLAFPMELYATLVGALSMLIVVGCSLARFKTEPRQALFSLLGSLLFLIAGLFVGTEGMLGSLHRIDLFHLLLALAVIGIAAGLPGRSADW